MPALNDLLKRLDERLILGDISEETYKEIKERLQHQPDQVESYLEIPRFCPSCGRGISDNYFLCFSCDHVFCLDCRQGSVPVCLKCGREHDEIRASLETGPGEWVPVNMGLMEGAPMVEEDPVDELTRRRLLEAEATREEIAHMIEELEREGNAARLCEWSDLEMLMIPGGSFIYGLEDGEGTKVQRSLVVESFYMSRFPVTNAQYEVFLVETKNEPPYYWKDKRFSDPLRPVVGVPWEEALAFCEWLSKKTGIFYRLPLEVEWEKAARSVDGRPFPWGYDEPSLRYCRLTKDIASTEKVGAHPDGASPYGCEDMLGNIWQWCADAVVDEACQTDPSKQMKALDFRVCRGGSWGHVTDYLKCASRDYPIFRLIPLGFRVARSLGFGSCMPGQAGSQNREPKRSLK